MSRTLHEFAAGIDSAALGEALHARVRAWYRIPRSLTGEGLRAQLREIAALIPLEVHALPSGAPAFDWSIPPEWNLREAYIADAQGRRVVDFADHHLHVMGYSAPVNARMTKEELAAHVYTDPAHPAWIPYRTSYYASNWAFCMAHAQWDALPEAEYEVVIESTLEAGEMNWGECILPGESEEIVLISAHACHPQLANDNCSGLAVAVELARALAQLPVRRYTYHFVFAPGTIGAIAWLAQNESLTPRIRHGLTLACVGDAGGPTYKRSRRGDAVIDRAAAHVLAQRFPAAEVMPFSPYGYDERQYCSPGFDLPVGCFMRSRPGGFPEYHSSADNLNLVQPAALAASYLALLDIIDILERDAVYLNTQPKCEPQLGKRGLYDAVGGRSDAKQVQLALLWVLNQSDGANSLLDIAVRAEMPFAQVRAAADALLAAGLLRPV